MDFAPIISWILWRLRPALWLNGVLQRFCLWAIDMFEDEDKSLWLAEHPKNCAWFGGWLVIAEARLDELIRLRACEIARLYAPTFPVGPFHPAHGFRDPVEALRRFARFLSRFRDIERLARLRAQRMLRQLTSAPVVLVPDRRPQPAPVSAGLLLLLSLLHSPPASGAGFRSAPAGERIRAPP